MQNPPETHAHITHTNTPAQRKEATYVVCLDTSPSANIVWLGKDASAHLSKTGRNPDPTSAFRQTGSPLTGCTVLVSLLNDKITAGIIQSVCSQPENAQTAVAMRNAISSWQIEFWCNKRQIFGHKSTESRAGRADSAPLLSCCMQE